jgi:serine/threonine-protein kinase
VSGDPPAAADASAGTRIAGYLLEEQIGQGGMAVVYRATDERLDRRVALKLLAPALTADSGFRQRFIRESRAAAAVDHPNIIPVYDAGDAGGSLFIAMRYVQGGDARSLLRRAGPLPAARVWTIIAQVAAALDAAHGRGLVHRDVKPANMLLDAGTPATGVGHGLRPDDQPEHVYLADFGISKQTLSSQLTSTGQFVGTLDYIAPEQIEGRDTDGRADQYALACAAFELLSGTPPFRRDQSIALLYAQLNELPPTVSARRSGLPAATDLVLAKALAKTPAARYESCGQFAADLGRALNFIPGPVQAGRPLLPSGFSMTGDMAKPWPATELADPVAPPLGGLVPPLPGVRLGREGPTRTPAHDQHQPGNTRPQGQGQGQGQGQYEPTRLSGAGGQAPPPGDPSRGQGGWPGDSSSPPGPYGTAPFGGPGVGYGTGASGSQPPGRRQGSRLLLIGAGVVAIIVAAAAVAVVAFHVHLGPLSVTPNSSPSVTPTASSTSTVALAQATAVHNLLTTSGASRQPLQNAIKEVMACTNLPGAVAQIQTVVNQRNAEYNKASAFSTGALRNGATVKNDLMLALLNSLDADKDYLTWAQQQESGPCPAQTSAYDDALTADGQANNSKFAFVSVWNQIAAAYGFAPASAGNI